MMVDVEGMTPEEAAKKWIAENQAVWKAWVAQVLTVQTA